MATKTVNQETVVAVLAQLEAAGMKVSMPTTTKSKGRPKGSKNKPKQSAPIGGPVQSKRLEAGEARIIKQVGTAREVLRNNNGGTKISTCFLPGLFGFAKGGEMYIQLSDSGQTPQTRESIKQALQDTLDLL